MADYVEGFGGDSERRSGDDAWLPAVHAVAVKAAFNRSGHPRPAAALCGARVSIGSLSWDPTRNPNHCKKCARKTRSAAGEER